MYPIFACFPPTPSSSFSVSYTCTFPLTSPRNALQGSHCLCPRGSLGLLSWCPATTSRFLSESRQLAPRGGHLQPPAFILQRKGDGDERDGQTGAWRNSGPTEVSGAGPVTEGRGDSEKKKTAIPREAWKKREAKAHPLRMLQDKLT